MNRDSALATLVAWQQRYQIPFQFCGSRTEAERFAQSYFHQQLKAHLAKLLEVQRTLAADARNSVCRGSMAKLSKWDYRRQRDRLIHELRQQGLSLRAIARALHCSKTTVAAVLNQERVYSRIAPWLVLEESTNPEVVAQRISMLFGERFLEQLTQACLGKCRELPAMQTSVYQVVEQLRQRFTPQELGSIAMMLSAEMGYQQYQRQRW